MSLPAALLLTFVAVMQSADPRAGVARWPSGAIVGQVLFDDRVPLPGTTVAAVRITPVARPVIVSAVTAADGRFSIDNLTAGRYLVVVSMPGWAPLEATVEVADGPANAPAFLMKTIGMCQCLGYPVSIRNPEGQAIPGTRVQLVAADGTSSAGPLLDSNGEAVIWTSRGQTVVIDAPGYGQHRLTAPGRIDADFMLPWKIIISVSPDLIVEAAKLFTPTIPDITLWPGEVVVGVATTMGDFMIAVDAVRAPITSAAFLKYVDAGLYDSGLFSPAAPKMGLIKGAINPQRRRGASSVIRPERTGIRHAAGVVSLARGTGPVVGPDFVVLVVDQPSLDAGNRGGAAFGRVVAGLDIIRRIQQQPVQGQNLTPPVSIIAIRRAR